MTRLGYLFDIKSDNPECERNLTEFAEFAEFLCS